MNNVVNAILTRRSVRAFTDKQIRKEDLDVILKCASYAPSAMNTQNWHFTAIRDAAFIEKVNGWIVSEIRESGNPNLEGIQAAVSPRRQTTIAPTCVLRYNFGSRNPGSRVELRMVGGQNEYTCMAHRGAVRGVALQ